MATADWLSKFSEITGEFRDSRVYDPGDGCVQIGACLAVAGYVGASSLHLPWGEVPDPPPAGSYALYVVEGGRAYLRTPDATELPLLAIPAGWMPRGISTGDGLEAGRIYDPGAGPIFVGAGMRGPDAGWTLTGGSDPGASLTLQPTTHATPGPVVLSAGSYLLLPVVSEIPTPPAGWVAVGMTAAGLAAVASTGEPTSPVECGWCGVDGGVVSPEPGESCMDAADVIDGVPVAAEHPGGATEHWWRLEAPLAVTYRLEVDAESSGDLTYTFLRGGTCGTLTEIGSTDEPPACIDGATVGLESVWCKVTSTAGDGGSYSITMAEGDCP